MTLKKPINFITTFDSYIATKIIGEGRSGRVYEVANNEGELFAVKLLKPEFASKEKIKRFKNELKFCQENRHPNIVTVEDHGLYSDGKNPSPFYVMPLADGSLRDLMARAISADDILIYFFHLLDGVEAAHLKNVVHRDLKPENVLYDKKNDRLMLADFGIAQFEQDELYTAAETKDDARLANFQYAAPEQKSRGQKADHRADIFALGLILNEMFTGEVPNGTNFEMIGAVTDKYEYLDDLVDNMLQQSPDKRPSSIEVIKNQLIARENEFIISQRISELTQHVIPVTELDDPLIADPPRLVNYEWDGSSLTLILSREVNKNWIWAINNMGSYGSSFDKGPEKFAFAGDTAIVWATEPQIQPIINYFKKWLPRANRIYEERVRRDKTLEEEGKKKLLQRELEMQEALQRVRRNTTI